MLLRYGVLNLVVFMIILLVVSKNYDTWTHSPAPETWAASKPVAKVEIPKIVEEKKDPLNPSSEKIISERNIFSPERKDYPVPSGTEGKKPIVRPQVILYGVTMAGDYQSASISNPGRALRKGEREAMTLKIGDKVGEYKLSKILPDRIELEAIQGSFEVLLYDPNKPKQRIYAKADSKPAAITSSHPTSSVSTTTSATSSQINTPQEGPSSLRYVIKRDRPTSATPYPHPTLRSRRPSNETNASLPIGSPGAFIGPNNPKMATDSDVHKLNSSHC